MRGLRLALRRGPPCALAPHAVEYWAIPLDGTAAVAAAARALLPGEARERAARFRFEADRRRYAIAHAALSVLLAAYAGTRPGRLRFARARGGKPVLASPASDLHFSLSHSCDLAMVAVTRAAPLGVDVERLRPLAERELVARRSFSRSEYAVLQGVAPDARDLAFFQCWTRKEAYVKALGDGLRARLDRFEVSLRPGEAAGIASLDGSAAAAAAWSLHHLAPAAGYVGAMAIRARPSRVAGWTFDISALACSGAPRA